MVNGEITASKDLVYFTEMTRLVPFTKSQDIFRHVINRHKRMLRRGGGPQPPDHQLGAHPTEPPRSAYAKLKSQGHVLSCHLCLGKTPNQIILVRNDLPL